MNIGGSASLDLTEAEVTQVSVEEYNVNVINSITDLYPGFRQDSKMP